ncbi:hypothetical protein BFP72_07675 [Reichenbachiella sp. 5M10]|nr:hypothetical protein BFP72_07675 [Reichenbachiella sp. 5M10]
MSSGLRIDQLIDSLNTYSLEDSQKVELLCQIAYHHHDPMMALQYGQQSLQLAQTLNRPLLIARAYEELAEAHRVLGNEVQSRHATTRALRIYENENEYHLAAALYAQTANYLLKDQRYDQAIRLLESAKQNYKKSGDNKKYALTCINLGEAFRLTQHYDSAKHYLYHALTCNYTEDSLIRGYALGNLGMVYHESIELKNAKEYLIDGIAIVEKLKDPYSTSVYLAELGRVYQQQGLKDQAEKHLLKAIKMAQDANLKEQIRDFSQQLSFYYAELHDYRSSLQYQRLFQIYQDSLVNKTNIQLVERIKAEYEIDKKNSEIQLLDQINLQRTYAAYGLALGVVLLVCLSLLLHRKNEQAKTANDILSEQKETLAHREKEKAVLLHELNHRVKNNLQMISSLLNMQKHELVGHPAEQAIHESKHRIDALSLIHQRLYQQDTQTKISVKEYFTDLILNLVYSYGREVKCTFDISDTPLLIDILIPLALITNELVTNALKYAFEETSEPNIHFEFQTKPCCASLLVRDNGSGFDPSQQKEGFGLVLTRTLVAQLDGDLRYTNQNGSIWTLHIKIDPLS